MDWGTGRGPGEQERAGRGTFVESTGNPGGGESLSCCFHGAVEEAVFLAEDSQDEKRFTELS